MTFVTLKTAGSANLSPSAELARKRVEGVSSWVEEGADRVGTDGRERDRV